MKLKTFFFSLMLLMVASLATVSTAQAQCTTCNTTISAINLGPVLGPLVRVYTVNTGYNAPCNNPTYTWTCTPAATILNAGGQARYTFPVAGTYTVTCTFTVYNGGVPCPKSSSRTVVVP